MASRVPGVGEQVRARVGRLLRRWADRIDPDNAPQPTGYTYTHERHTPTDTRIKWRDDGRGCPVYYIGEADLTRSFTEADTDWRPAAERLKDTFEKFGTGLNEAMRNALKVEWKDTP